MKAHSTLYIKTKWEMKGEINPTAETWVTIRNINRNAAQSWKDFGCKSLIRYFITQNPTIKITPQLAGEIVEIQMQIIIIFFGIVGLLKPIVMEYIMQIQKILGSRLHPESKALFFGLMSEG